MLYCVFFLLSKCEKSFYMTIEIFYAIISQKHIFHNLISFSMGSWQSALPVGFNRWNLKEERLSLPVGYQRKSCFYSKIKMNKAGGLIFREKYGILQRRFCGKRRYRTKILSGGCQKVCRSVEWWSVQGKADAEAGAAQNNKSCVIQRRWGNCIGKKQWSCHDTG